jgi:hypothetical protein
MFKRILLALSLFAVFVSLAPAQTTITDSFADTAGITLESHTSGGVTWTHSSSTNNGPINEMVIRSAGGARQASPGAGGSLYAATAPTVVSADYAATATFVANSSPVSGNIGVAARMQSDAASAYYTLYQSAINTVQLYLVTGGGTSYAALGSAVSFTPALGTPFSLGVTVSGTAISMQLNGSTVGTVTDATLSTGTPGFQIYGTASISDTTGVELQSFMYSNVTVAPGSPTISISVGSHLTTDAPFTVAATSNSSGALTYSVISGPATISGATVTLTGAGTVVLQVSQAAAGSYTSGTQTTSFTVTSSVSTPAIPANDPSLLYSPWNWATGTYANGTYTAQPYAAAVNPGAYIRQVYTLATSCTLSFDATNTSAFNTADSPHVKVRVDNGSWVSYPVAATINISAQLNPNSGTAQTHLLEVVFASVNTSGGQERFNVASGTGIVAPTAALIFRGMTYNSGATWAAPPRRKYNVLLFGDSITEAIDALGYNGTAVGTNNDATAGWAFMMQYALDAEVGVVGFSGQAVANTNYFSHTATSTYASIYQGVARNFASPKPDAAGLDWGTNDAASTLSNFVAGIQTISSTIKAVAPAARFFMWEDYRAQQTAGEIAAMNAIGGTLITGLLDNGFMTNGVADSYDSNHPTATTHATKMLPIISSAVSAILHGRSYSFF